MHFLKGYGVTAGYVGGGSDYVSRAAGHLFPPHAGSLKSALEEYLYQGNWKIQQIKAPPPPPMTATPLNNCVNIKLLYMFPLSYFLRLVSSLKKKEIYVCMC